MGPGLALAGTPLARAKCNLPVYCPRPASLNFALNRTRPIHNRKSTMNSGADISGAEPNRDCQDDPSERPLPCSSRVATPPPSTPYPPPSCPEPQFPSCLICTRGRSAQASLCTQLQSSLRCRKVLRTTAAYCGLRGSGICRHQTLHNSAPIASTLPPIF